MHTIAAGLASLRRNPLAVLPLLLEGAIAALLIAVGVWRADGGSVLAGAAFPLDVFFDLRRSLSFDSSWGVFLIAVVLSLSIRSAALATTLWLADDGRTSLTKALRRTVPLVLRAQLVLLPVAALMFAAVAIRYSPFVVVAGLAGALVSWQLSRRGANTNAGWGAPGEGKVPDLRSFLFYGYALSALSVVVDVVGGSSRAGAGALVLCASGLSAIVLLGWREHLVRGTVPADGRIALGVTGAGVALLLGFTIYDRYITGAGAVRLGARGSLLYLSGADSTSHSGSLHDLDPHALGYERKRRTLLSYRGPGKPYGSIATHEDLARAAELVAPQIADAPQPRALLGHSQAALILDRILAGDLPAPDVAVLISPPPPFPPDVDVPPPGMNGPGRVGGDLIRLIGAALEPVGLGYETDAPAAPANLRAVIVASSPVPRLSVWALGDSLWLEGDWRRPGEVNMVTISDHVGAVRDPRTLEAARRFLAGREVGDDESSWRGWLVNVYRYALEPWRP